MEYTRKTDFLTLEHGIGSIEAGPNQQERLNEITERLKSDEFYVAVQSAIPSQCIDGRTGAQTFAPNAAGGSESIMVADDLTFQRFDSDGTTKTAYASMLEYMQAQQLPVGGHTDDHATGEKSGCGANDRLPEIYAFMSTHGELLRSIAAKLGVTISNTARDRIIANATARTEFSKGDELLTELRSRAGNDAVDPLHGEHREVIAVVNTVAGTTLDRNTLETEFGSDYEAFNIDIWAFQEAAEVIAADEHEISELVAAMIFYNLATAHVLCGPAMRVIVRS